MLRFLMPLSLWFEVAQKLLQKLCKRRAPAAAKFEICDMTFVDLIKATVVCGGLAFMIYTYPVVGQVVIIALLSVLWLACAHQTLAHLRRR
jgi:hypothetical protein